MNNLNIRKKLIETYTKVSISTIIISKSRVSVSIDVKVLNIESSDIKSSEISFSVNKISFRSFHLMTKEEFNKNKY